MSLLAIYSHLCDVIKFGITVEVCVLAVTNRTYL